MIAEKLRTAILQAAISGQLTKEQPDLMANIPGLSGCALLPHP